MSRALKPYPEYRDASVPWLGDVPAHWRVLRTKFVARAIVGGSTPPANEPECWNGGIVWVTPEDISRADVIRGSRRTISERGFAACSTRMVPAGSVIVTSRAPVGNVAIAAVDLCTNQGCKAIIPDPRIADGEFLYHLLGSLADELQSLATGTTFQEISTWATANLRLPIPPLEEQMAISRFLLHADLRISRLIRAKRRLIGLLNEEKQAIIGRVVTRGMDPHVAMKPSGIEWLGEVPAHWKSQRCGYLFSERVESGYPDLPVLEVSIHRGVQVRDAQPALRKQALGELASYKRAKEGDLAYNMMRMWQGAVGVAPVDGLVSPAYVVAAPRQRVSTQYYALLFRTEACKGELNARSRGIVADRNRLYWDDFRQVTCPVPPYAEQLAIVQYVDEQSSAIDDAIARAHSEIDLIREYRTRLIADVVTGKLDVRGVPLPEAEEMEGLALLGEADGAEESTDMGDAEEMPDGTE